jgi:hypothetical protein
MWTSRQRVLGWWEALEDDILGFSKPQHQPKTQLVYAAQGLSIANLFRYLELPVLPQDHRRWRLHRFVSLPPPNTRIDYPPKCPVHFTMKGFTNY